MKGINLLEKSALETEETKGQSKKITLYSVIILVFFALINLFIFLYRIDQSQKISNWNEQVALKKTQVSGLKNIEVKYYLIKQKANFLSNLDKEKINIPLLIGFFSQMESLGNALQSVSFQADKIALDSFAKDSEALSNSLILLMENDEGKQLFKSVELSSLSLDKEKGYRFNINLVPRI